MEEILFWCRQFGCRIGETPIRFEDRRASVTKINKHTYGRLQPAARARTAG